MRILICVLLAIATPCFAQDRAVATRMELAWRDWAAAKGVEVSAIAIAFKGEPVLEAGLARRADEPVAIASLSKAITAACVESFLPVRGYDYDTTLATVLADAGGVQKPYGELQIRELLTHVSGLVAAEYILWRSGWPFDGPDRYDEGITRLEEAQPALTGHGEFIYGNLGYFLLGRVIEALSGQPYFKACSGAVFEDDAAFGPYLPLRVIGAFAGWEVSARDYLKFVHDRFGDGATINTDPFAYPNAHRWDDQYYGMGADFKGSPETGFDYWHFGSICVQSNPTGTYFGVYRNGWEVVVNYRACVHGERQRDLHVGLLAAANQP